jgi:hypothetical protein
VGEREGKEGSMRFALYGSVVVVVALALAFVAVALTLNT